MNESNIAGLPNPRINLLRETCLGFYRVTS